MKNTISLLLATLFLWSAAATAHGPTRQKVAESITINTSPDVVWGVIKNFADAGWMPMVAKTQGQGGNAPGATREITLKAGGTIKEELKKYDDAEKSLSYKIIKDGVDMKVLPVNDYSASLTVSAEGSGAKVEWKGAFYRGYMNNCPCPPELTEEAAITAVTKIYKDSLASLKALAEKK